MKQLLLFTALLTLLFSCGGNGRKPKAPDTDQLVHRWIDAHNQKNTQLFSAIYAEKVNYYGKLLSKAEVIEDKFGIFETAPDFHKELKGRIVPKTLSPAVVVCTFYNKTSASQESAVRKKVLTFQKIAGKWLIVQEGGEKTTLPQSSQIPESARGNMTFKYEPNYSAVRGKIVFETFDGAPGYGQTTGKNEPEVCPVLLPETPINVLAESKDNYTSNVYGVTKIQLVSTNGINFRLYRKKNVRLTGKFFAPETGHHHTDVLLDVEMIEEI